MNVVSTEGILTLMIDVDFTRDFLEELMAIWPDPDTGKIGINQSCLSRHSGVTQSAISNYLKKGKDFRYPQSPELRKLGRFFKIIRFVEDWTGKIDNDDALERIKVFLEAYVYKQD